MATDTSTELETFQFFLALQVKQGKKDMTPEESVERFRAYQDEVKRLQREIAPALEQSDRGKSEPLDLDLIIQAGLRRWNDQRKHEQGKET